MSQGQTIIIIGANGRMGAALCRHYRDAHRVLPFTRAELDVSKTETIRPSLASLHFDLIIYAAGSTDVDGCEDRPEEALRTNCEAPRELARICLEKGARFIHVSTDYVFDGSEEGFRKEDDPAEPASAYGRSKLAGEKAVLEVSGQFLVTRISWLFGPDRDAFPDSILKKAQTHSNVEAIADKWSSPTYSEDLAEWIRPMLFDPGYKGIFHLSNSGFATWQEYGQKTLDIAASYNIPLQARTVSPLYLDEVSFFRAQRPRYTAFNTSRFQGISGITPRHWEKALEAHIVQKYVENK